MAADIRAVRAGEKARGRARQRGDLRTQVMAVVAWTAGSTALATALYPELAAALFAFLVGVVSVVALRTSLARAAALGAAAVIPFTFADLALTTVAADPGAVDLSPLALLVHPAAHHPDVLSYLLLGAALLVASAAVADTASAVIGHLPVEFEQPGLAHSFAQAIVSEREQGMRRAEWEIARAEAYGREMALALVGVDAPMAGDFRTDEVQMMEKLDELILGNVTRFDVVAAYGPRDRLMALPEESAQRLSGDAAQLCELASARLRRQVRMALVTFPQDGQSLRELLTELEVDLATCRVNGIAVQLAGVPFASSAPRGPMGLNEDVFGRRDDSLGRSASQEDDRDLEPEPESERETGYLVPTPLPFGRPAAGPALRLPPAPDGVSG